MPYLQTEFPFPSLDFPGRGALRPSEIAERLNVTEEQILKLIDKGEIRCALDVSSRNTKSGRKWRLIPIEAYRNFILSRIEGDLQGACDILCNLPRGTLIRLQIEITDALSRKAS